MIAVSNNWINYFKEHDLCHIRGTLTDKNGNTLNLDEADFMLGTIAVSDATSDSSSFTVGSVITNTFKCVLNNIDGKFNGFTLGGAELAVEFGVIYEDESEEWIQRGVYTLDSPSFLGYTYDVVAYDHMDLLNRQYTGYGSSGGTEAPISFPVDSDVLVQLLCEYCGAAFGSWNLPNNLPVSAFDFNESTTCREVIGWVVQINGGFARVNNVGELECKWYNTGTWVDIDSLDGGIMAPWGSDETADGGTMEPWSIGADIDGGISVCYFVDSVSECQVSAQDIKVTGIRAYVPNTVDEYEFGQAGTSGYILAIQDNPLVNSSNKNIIAKAVSDVCGDARFRPFTATIYGNPAYEAGDTVGIYDYLGNIYLTYITNLTYTFNGQTSIECGADTPSDNENAYANSSTAVMQGSVKAAYDYLQARKIQADMIAAGAVTSDSIATNAVTADKIAAGSVTADKLSAQSISADKIAAGTISAAVTATNLNMAGGTINIETSATKEDWIKLQHNTGTGNLKALVSPSNIGVSYGTNYFAEFWNNGTYNSSIACGHTSGQSTVYTLLVNGKADTVRARNMTVSGTKNRLVKTGDYSERLLYCYETPSPLFGDIGEGTIGEDGLCYVWLEPIFAQTIDRDQYQVFLQKYGAGECWIRERRAGCFVVEGTPGLSFGWELKAKQFDYTQKRLDTPFDLNYETVEYGDLGATYIKELFEGRKE